MITPRQPIHQSFLGSIYQGATNGATEGAIFGAKLIGGTLGYAGLSGSLETGFRAVGGDPRWPMFEGDCQSQQFRDLPVCTNEPMFQSFTSLSIFVIVASTLAGSLIGGISGGLGSRSF